MIAHPTSEILKALAPEFVALDEAERMATQGEWERHPNKRYWVLLPENDENNENNALFCVKARNQIRDLLDAYAQALVKLAKAKEQMEIAMLDCSVVSENRADAENLRRSVRDRLKKCLAGLEPNA